MENLFRHGDVLLKRIDKLPDDITPIHSNVVQAGEVTGHHHRFASGQVQVFEDKNGNKFVEAKTSAELVHEEHHKIDIEPGNYAVVIEREFSPFTEELERRVRD